MTRSIAGLAVLICATTLIGATTLVYALAPSTATAATDADKAALASCKAEVKEYAKYNETSWWQRHKMVQKCVKDAVAKK
jgi:hypothetical protein